MSLRTCFSICSLVSVCSRILDDPSAARFDSIEFVQARLSNSESNDPIDYYAHILESESVKGGEDEQPNAANQTLRRKVTHQTHKSKGRRRRRKGHVNGKKLCTFVLTSENSTRLPSFLETWAAKWPDQEFTQIEGPDIPKGVGVQEGFTKILKKSLEDKSCHSTVVFEDDALPFEHARYPDDILALREEGEKVGAKLILLGANNIHSCGYKEPLTNVHYAHGGYGWVIPQGEIQSLVEHWELEAKPKPDKLCPDISWYYGPPEGHVYVATPLLVDHPKFIYSHNWNTKFDYHWAGNARWWEVAKTIKSCERDTPYEACGHTIMI